MCTVIVVCGSCGTVRPKSNHSARIERINFHFTHAWLNLFSIRSYEEPFFAWSQSPISCRPRFSADPDEKESAATMRPNQLDIMKKRQYGKRGTRVRNQPAQFGCTLHASHANRAKRRRNVGNYSQIHSFARQLIKIFTRWALN